MSVLLVRPRATGGLAAHVDQERELLRAAGMDVTESAARIQERPAPRADLASWRTLRREMRTAARPLGVHAHGLRAGALAALARPRRDRRVRLVVTLHNRTLGSLPVRAIGGLLLRILARGADTVLAVSPDLAEQARRAGARDVRHAVIPAPPAAAGAPDPEAPDTDSPDTDPLRVLVLARLAPQKGLEDLLDAAALLDPGQVRIEVAGEGPQRPALQSRIDAERLPVTLLGHRADVPALLADAQLVVSAARWEGQPVGLQEALRAGRAVVATDAGGTRWVTGDAATLVPVDDPSVLAAAIAAQRDPVHRRRAELAARERALTLPDAADLTAQLVDLLAPTGARW